MDRLTQPTGHANEDAEEFYAISQNYSPAVSTASREHGTFIENANRNR